MFFIVVGCGRVGASGLPPLPAATRVAVIDFLGSSSATSIPDNGGVRWRPGARQRVKGRSTRPSPAAVTNSDTQRGKYLARTVYHTKRRGPQLRSALFPCIRPSAVRGGLHAWGAQRIEMLYHPEGRTVFGGNGGVEVSGIAIPEAWGGPGIQTILESTACLPVAVTRAGKDLLPTTDVRLETGDLMLVSATLEGIETLRRRLAEAEER